MMSLLKSNEDLINKLHDDLLIQILSLVPHDHVISARVVSRRWNHLYDCLPNVFFQSPSNGSVEEVDKFHNFVDKTLALRRVQNIAINKFSLHCLSNYHDIRVNDILCNVLQCKVQQLLLVPYDEFKVIRICWDLFKSCNTLVALTLKDLYLLDVPEREVLFPSLKKLTLEPIYCYLGDKSFQNLISGCPVLQQLVYKNLYNLDSFCKVISIASASLKRLEIDFSKDVYNPEVVIDTPNLKFISIVLGYSKFTFSFTRPLSLVEAHICADLGVALNQILTAVSTTKILSLTIKRVFDEMVFFVPKFHNTVKFVVDFKDIAEWDLLFTLLNNMPNLEELVFLEGHHLQREWNRILPVEPPACLRFKIRKIVILRQRVVPQKELTLISYFLKHSNNLETLKLNEYGTYHETREEILNFHRGSGVCQIEFV